MYQRFGKRTFDLLISLFALMILSPVMLVLAAWIIIDSRGPVIFCQKRFARNGELFNIYKFRTMRCDTPSDVPTHLLPNPDNWITSSGKFLRFTSLDELPQLFNILRGEMAIIGPRPALYNQYDLMELRHSNGSDLIRPGLSGWAQIHGRDEISIEEKAGLDGYYASHITLKMDICCILSTFGVISSKKGFREGMDTSLSLNRESYEGESVVQEMGTYE